MKNKRDGDDECACPFSKPGEGDFTFPEYWDPPASTATRQDCFDACQDAFLTSLTGQIHVSNVTCQLLEANGQGGNIFWALYDLNMKYCGLQLSSVAHPDPGVESIISTCDNIGYGGLEDPSWPPTSYQCSVCPLDKEQQIEQTSTISRDQAASTAISRASISAAAVGSSSSSSSASPNMSGSTTAPGAVATHGAPSATSLSSSKSTAAAAASNSNSTLNTPPGQRLSTQGIVAIAVCSTIAVTATILLLFCALRRRRRQQEALGDSSIGGLRSRISRVASDFAMPPVESYQPLISPTSSLNANDRAFLTPPLRLRDRKILPSLLLPSSYTEQQHPLPVPPSIVIGPSCSAEGRHPSGGSSLYSSTGHSPEPAAAAAAAKAKATATTSSPDDPMSPFPLSAVCAPRSNKLEPRLEKLHSAMGGTTARAAYSSPAPISSSCTAAATATVLSSSASPEPSSPPYTQLGSPPLAPPAPVSLTFPLRSSLDVPPLAINQGHRRGGGNANNTNNSNKHDYNNPSRGDFTTSSRHHHNRVASPTPISTNPFAPTPPSSPVRPRRPHDEPLEIPDLVSPLSSPARSVRGTSPSPGPAPRVALPPPPPPAALLSVPGSVGEGIGIARTTGVEEMRGHGVHYGGGGGRGRDSWGSWEDVEDGEEKEKLGGVASPSLPARRMFGA